MYYPLCKNKHSDHVNCWLWTEVGSLGHYKLVDKGIIRKYGTIKKKKKPGFLFKSFLLVICCT